MRSPISLATQSTVAVQRPTPPLAAKRVQRASSWAAIGCQLVLPVMGTVNKRELFKYDDTDVLVDMWSQRYVLGYGIEFSGYMRIPQMSECRSNEIAAADGRKLWINCAQRRQSSR